MSAHDYQTLGDLLDALDAAGDGRVVTVQDILDEIGERSIMPVVLAISILLVSPLSGIPGVPTVSSLIILLIVSQAVVGRTHLWLPGMLRQRKLRTTRLHRATEWLRRPAAWVDGHSYPRLHLLSTTPFRMLSLLLCMVVPLVWPFLELLPMVTSIGAAAVAFLSFGLLTRDGIYVLAGYTTVAGMALTILWLVQAAT